MLCTIRSNLGIGTENESAFSGTNGRAETSNNPMTALGLSASFSRKGYRTTEEHPDPNGVKTSLGSVSSKFARVKRPDNTSGLGKENGNCRLV